MGTRGPHNRIVASSTTVPPTSVPDIPVSQSAMLRAAHDIINLEAMTEEGICRGTWATVIYMLNSSHSHHIYHIFAAYHAHSEKLPQEGFDLVNGSGPLFSLYLGMAEEEDRKMAESWKADADGILVFVSPSCCLS
jgi:hypothetical protein